LLVFSCAAITFGSFTATVQAFPHKGIVQLSAGEDNTCALMADHHVSCWGSGNVANSTSPLPVPKINAAISVASGNGFACALLLDQTVWCWGVNSSGQLGDATFSPRAVNPAPVLTSGHPFNGATAITVGNAHACALKSPDSTVYCWGSNSDGQLGNWNIGIGTNFNTPLLVVIHDGASNPALGGVGSISAGAFHTCATIGDPTETAACWGYDPYGQLGNTTAPAEIDSPVTVEAPDGSALGMIEDGITAGEFHTCTVIPELAPANNSLACWGDNTSGELGNPFELGFFTAVPAPVVFSDGVNKLTNVKYVGAGNSFSCALLADTSAACWGSDFYGQLGNNFEMSGFSVSPLAVASSGSTITGFDTIAVGANHVCGLIGGTRVLCWGSNGFGQLGIGSTDGTTHALPVNAAVDSPIFADNLDND
jgi:alpha-tubulin suppressor-like RCC1 family protein